MKTMLKVYLDDERQAPKGWIRTKNVNSTINLLKREIVEELSLDHDLGTDKECGYDVLLWIEKQVHLKGAHFLLPKLRIHTANPSARKKMILALGSIQNYYGSEK